MINEGIFKVRAGQALKLFLLVFLCWKNVTKVILYKAINIFIKCLC